MNCPHTFEPITEYCIVCGCRRRDYEDGFREKCDEHGNVSGVSHIIALKRLEGLIRESTAEEPWKCGPAQS